MAAVRPPGLSSSGVHPPGICEGRRCVSIASRIIYRRFIAISLGCRYFRLPKRGYARYCNHLRSCVFPFSIFSIPIFETVVSPSLSGHLWLVDPVFPILVRTLSGLHRPLCLISPLLSAPPPSIPSLRGGGRVAPASHARRISIGNYTPISPPSTSSQPTTVTLPPITSAPSSPGRESGTSSSSNSMRGLPVCSASSSALFTISVMSRSI